MLYYRDYKGYERKDEGVPRFSGHPDDLIWCPTVCYSKHDLYNLVDKQKKVKIDSCKALLNYWLCFTDIAAQLRISNQLSWIEKDDLFLKGFDREFQGEILRRLKWNDRREYADNPWPTCQVTREAERLLKEGYCFKLREACLARDQQSAREAQYEAEMQESRAVRMEEKCQGLEKCSESVRLGSKALQSPSSTSFEIQLLTHNSQDSSKLLKAPGEGSRGQAVEVEGIEVAAAELSSSPLVEHRCEPSFDHLQVTSYIAEESLTAELQGECLQGNLEEQSEEKLLGAKASAELEVTEALGDLPVPQPEYLHLSLSPCTDNSPQIPPIELQDAEDELRANEQPINTEACATDVLKPTPEPRGDLCEVQEQVGCTEVEEIEPRVEVERPSKVVAQRKPPEAKIRRKTLKSVTRMIKEILPEFQITHSSSRLSGWTILLIFLQQGWTWSLGVETCMMSPSMLSQPAKRSGATTLRVNDTHSLAPRTCSAAAVEIDAGLSQTSENCIFEGYEVLGGKVKAPHSGGWSSILESTAISSTRKPTEEAIVRVRTPETLCKKKWMPPCVEGEVRRLYGVLYQVFEAVRLGIEPKQSPGPHWHSGQDLSMHEGFEESNKHETPLRLVCLLWRVLSVFLEDTLWSALSHWTLTLVRGLVFLWMLRESEEVAKRSPSLDIRSSKNPLKVKRREE
ncbi:hypothetical protein F5141DRAFT_1067541 [Pisolithus sp. B1]|nr:hypothetical protein F5141DRAFT_1067541 [Pisolithus sp. B1]